MPGSPVRRTSRPRSSVTFSTHTGRAAPTALVPVPAIPIAPASIAISMGATLIVT